MLDYLCEELIVEIFTRLPPKSLLRFRSLSKSLCSCISSPGFIRMHTFRSPQKFFFKHYQKEAYFYTLHGEDELPLCPTRGFMGMTPLQFPCSTFNWVLGLCNGTFCLRMKEDLILWNPSIRRKLTVPECPERRSDVGIGLGFDPTTDDYKIVGISFGGKSSFVYAVKTGAWCAISSPTPLFSDMSCCGSFFFNGALHWAVHNTTEDNKVHSWILTFDLSTHVFGMIPLPESIRLWETTGLTTIHGSLALISYRMDSRNSRIEVWRDGAWSVVFNSGTDRIVITRAFQQTNNGDLLLKVYTQGVQVCNPKTGLRSRLIEFSAASLVVNMERCVESLHLLDMGTAYETNQLSLSISGGKKTSKARYLNNLFNYFYITFKPLFNMIRWFTR